jgi:hydrogenase/urease accessory protein HupE
MPLAADELRPGYLQLTQVTATEFEVTFKTPARGPDRRLGIYAEFDDSVSAVSEPLDGILQGAHVSHWRISHADGLAGSRIHIRGLRETSTDALLRIEYLDGSSQVHKLSPAEPDIVLPARQSWSDVAGNYLRLGIEHILTGLDHLLFVFALLLLVRGWRKLVATITAFTTAHSITLALSTLGIVVLPVPPVEAAIALSIVFVASEAVHLQQGRPGLSSRRPWLVAFVFGLLHGLGFAAVLQEIGLPEHALATALVLFNVGVEIGQLLFVAALLAIAWALKPILARPSPLLQRAPAYAVGIVATFWVIERTTAFWQV